MRYAKGDPTTRMLMRLRELEGQSGDLGPLASVSSLDEATESLAPMHVVLRTSAPPSKLSKRNWWRVGDSLWTVSLSLDDIDTLNGLPEVASYEHAAPLMAELNDSVTHLEARFDSSEWTDDTRPTGLGVIIGVIDVEGIDWRQPDFIDQQGRSRILYLWDTTLNRESDDPDPDDPATAPDEGVEYSGTYLSRALAGDPDAKVRHKYQENSHGTHVTGIAAGNGQSGAAGAPVELGKYQGVAPLASIIYVAVDARAYPAGLTHSVLVTKAIRYIYEKAAARNMPCVINMSLGQNLGGHDGETILERMIDEQLIVSGRAFVVAAGNEHESPTHACGTIRTGEQVDIRLSIGQTHARHFETRAELWYSSSEQFRVALRCPRNHVSLPMEPGYSDLVPSCPCGVRVFVDSTRFDSNNGDARIRINIERTHDAAGIWTIEVEGLQVRDGAFDIWVERTGLVNGIRDQPVFMGDLTDAKVRKSTTTPATARRCICVGNYNPAAKAIVHDSSRGKTRDGRRKPDVVAPGAEIWSTKARGTSTAARTQKSGTSMAAPHVAGVIALMLQKNRDLSSWTIQKILAATARPGEDGDPGWGFGSVSAKAALELTPPFEI